MAYKDLSNTAQAILAGMFMSDQTTLSMGNEQWIFTRVANDAMTELLFEGYVIATKANDCRASSLDYNLTEKGQKIKREKPQTWMRKHGRFSLTTERPA